MKNVDLKTLLLGSSLLASSFAFSTTVYAQEVTQEDAEAVATVVANEDEEDEIKGDNIIVTGSRIKRDTFSSISPLQVITTDVTRDIGLINPVDILQKSESATGQQIDSTFQGFVLDNGPASETISLRGLGASRTLLMMNSRRLAPAGVEGAPTSPSLNLVPSSLVDRYDILLDGASSVYGSDAVAGVVNMIMKKDFEGFDIDLSTNIAEQGGTDYTISGSWGKNWDRGFLGIGAEYDYQDEVTLADRSFTDDCEENVEIDENGRIRHLDIGDQVRYDVWFGGFQAAAPSPCVDSGIAGRIIDRGGLGHGSIYQVPGPGNTGIPGYIDQTFISIPLDGDNDGQQDFSFNQFAINGNDLETSLINEQKTYSIMAYGEYTFEGDANITPFFEALHTNLEAFGDAGTFQLFPTVRANNPFNPCGTNGIDCGTVQGTVTNNPGFIDRWNTYYRDRDPNRDGNTTDARICATFAGGLFDNSRCTPSLFGYGPYFAGPIAMQPVVAVDGDRTNFEVEIAQTRLVGGFKGDLPMLNFGSLSNWSFETSLTHSKSSGTSAREGIRDDRLDFSLGIDPNTGATLSAPCVAAPGSPVSADVADGCVAVNLFAPSLYSSEVVGSFATQAERDYLFDSRDFDTQYSQTVWSGFMTGNLLELPAGSLGVVVGAEYRVDDINSEPDDIARDGLFFGFFSDGGAVGKKYTREVYGELDIPLVADKKFFRELDLNVSGRITDDEFYGTGKTYSIKGGWRPFDPLLLKASFGTSFRAPNLRENFLRGQSGFGNVFDPCATPQSAINPIDGSYDPTLDRRDPDVLARCTREGVDPTNTGNGFSVYNIERLAGGVLDLREETSESFTAGFAFEQPWIDSIDLNIGASYYDISITDTVVGPSVNFITFDCYTNDRPTRSVFCDRISRDASNGNVIDIIDAGFINRDNETVRGIDLNVRLDKEFNAFDLPMEFFLDLRANKILEQSDLFIGDTGVESFDDDVGEFHAPELNGSIATGFEIDNKWRFTWQTRFIDSVQASGTDDFGNALGVDTSGNGFADRFADTCGGTFIGDVNCRDVNFADDYFVHTLGVRYTADTWTARVAVSNILDTDPPEINGNEGVTQVSNVPLGYGYDIQGRRFFFNVTKSFK